LKCVYKTGKLEVKLFLSNGKTIVNDIGGWRYKYGIMPEDTYEEFTDTAWEKLSKINNYIDGFEGYKTKFKNRIYINDYDIARKRIYRDELVKLTIEHTYKKVENPSIKDLQEDLGFNNYSELVFDREQELRKMMEV